MLDRTQMSNPRGVGTALSRIRHNAYYFRLNYVFITLVTTTLCMITSPGALLTMALLGAMWIGLFVIHNAPLRLPGINRDISPREQLLWASGVTFLTVFVFSKILSVLMYGLGLSLCLVAAHGSFREPDEWSTGGDVAPPASAFSGGAALGAMRGAFQGMINNFSGTNASPREGIVMA